MLVSYWEETNIWGCAGEIHTKKGELNCYSRDDIAEQSKVEEQFVDHKSQIAALTNQIIEDQEGHNGGLKSASKGCKSSDQTFYCYFLTIISAEWNPLD